MNEPTIRYAMVAVSAMYEDEGMIGFSPVAGTQSHQAFALESYNKAITSLVTAVRSNPESIRVPVMAAIIFVCLEFLRGNVDAALTHIESGIKMLKAWREKTFKDMTSLTAEAAFIEDELIPMFGWLNLLSSLFGRPSLDLYSWSSTSGSDTSHFSPHEPAKTIDKAKTALLDLVNATVKFIQSIGDAKYKDEITMEMMAEQIRLQTFMNDWNRNFEFLQQHDPSGQNEQIKLGCHLLRAVSLTINVWLAAALYPNETAWDVFKDEFEEIVRISGILIASSVRFPDELSKRFSFEMGIIPPLHFVAWKCRFPHIRRKALALLWTSPRRECLFESHRSFACFTRVMLVEEEGLNLRPGILPGPEDLSPEEARIHQVDIASVHPTPEGHAISFLLKPYGLDGPWHARTEYVDLGRVDLEKSFPDWFSPEDDSPWLSEDLKSALVEIETIEDVAPEVVPVEAIFFNHHSSNYRDPGHGREYESIETDVLRRKTIFSSQQSLGTPDRAHFLGHDYFVGPSEGVPTSCAPTPTQLPYRSVSDFGIPH